MTYRFCEMLVPSSISLVTRHALIILTVTVSSQFLSSDRHEKTPCYLARCFLNKNMHANKSVYFYLQQMLICFTLPASRDWFKGNRMKYILIYYRRMSLKCQREIILSLPFFQ